MKTIKVILADILGVLLIIGSILFGWLPGPGGIPMFLAGLSLLAINHKWAKKLLDNFKEQGMKFLNNFFQDHPVLMRVYDTVAILLFAGAAALIIAAGGRLFNVLATICAFVGLGLYLGNRKRMNRLVNYFNRFKSKN